jgi:hypothetical protein
MALLRVVEWSLGVIDAGMFPNRSVRFGLRKRGKEATINDFGIVRSASEGFYLSSIKTENPRVGGSIPPLGTTLSRNINNLLSMVILIVMFSNL